MSFDTTEINRTRQDLRNHDSVWLFGYGSLIYKAGFPYLERRPARIRGWVRRFWQGSHDHRGTPEAPGRVLTLIEKPGALCQGMAYRITPAVFEPLDVREKNGYLRLAATLEFDDGGQAAGLVYIAGPDNAAYVGSEPDADIAARIAVSRGPSGRNRDYVLDLAAALRELGYGDDHVFSVERHLLRLMHETPA